jgi:hypothetical protein
MMTGQGLSITLELLKHVGSPYFAVKGWVIGCLLRHQPVVFCFVLALDLGFWT